MGENTCQTIHTIIGSENFVVLPFQKNLYEMEQLRIVVNDQDFFYNCLLRASRHPSRGSSTGVLCDTCILRTPVILPL